MLAGRLGRPTAPRRRTLTFMAPYRAKREQTGQEPSSDPRLPVFVDSSGRRARNLRRAGYGLAGCAAAYMAVLGLSLMGATPFAPGALLPGDVAAPAAPRAQAPGGTPLAPPDDVSDAAGPSALLVPGLTGPGPSLAPPLVPGSPPPGAPAPSDTPEPQVPPTQEPPSPEQPADPDDPAAPAPEPGTPTPSPPAPPSPAPPTTAPPAPPAPEPTGPATGPSAPSGAAETPPPADPSVAEAP
ncbi:hypothetical protein GCM10010313_38920 [Streptomyces violarus]|uniref:Uncharacterized protein n=1 Tax=Streptomyces violarus TaxID=67380 RepID=A0A7W5F4N9_9ACTN|nr:hypothetical protein [Streptomyces violarus]GHD13636.1 hypothetical protein GCM10010313_38920 [Streptomyces violarus]